MDFLVETAVYDDRAVITLAGEIDFATSPQLRTALRAFLDQQDRWLPVYVVIENVEFIDSAGLSDLMSFRTSYLAKFDRPRLDRDSIVFVRPKQSILRIMRLSGLDASVGIEL